MDCISNKETAGSGRRLRCDSGRQTGWQWQAHGVIAAGTNLAIVVGADTAPLARDCITTGLVAAVRFLVSLRIPAERQQGHNDSRGVTACQVCAVQCQKRGKGMNGTREVY